MVMEVAPPILQEPTLAGAIGLLESAGLPVADITGDHMIHFFCVGPVAAPRGMVGVELYGSDALLRSLVVVPELRSTGLGTTLVKHVEHHAREQGARTVYLLTTMAEGFFRSRGYVATSRDSAPPSIRSTAEFAGLCPASSAFLSKRL